MNKKAILFFGAVLLFAAVIVSVVVSSVSMMRKISESPKSDQRIAEEGDATVNGIPEKFRTEEEFRKFFSERISSGIGVARDFSAMESSMAPSVEKSNTLSVGGSSPDMRFSETNVQVSGIDEPDIVKTNGEEIFFSREPEYQVFDRVVSMDDRGVSTPEIKMVSPGESSIYPPVPPARSDRGVEIIGALPADSMKGLGAINRSGEMLLFGDTLVVFESSGQSVVGFDVSDREHPKEEWVVRFNEGSSLLQARSRDGMLYIVERTWGGGAIPCPFSPATVGREKLTISCTDVYHPTIATSVDAVFTAFSVDPKTGTTKDSISFVGSSWQSTLYMSDDALYVASGREGDLVRLISGFFRENKDLLPDDAFNRIERLSGYDIGNDAKMTELSRIIETAFLGRDGGDRLKFENEMRNRMTGYLEKHLRESEFTDISKFSVPDLRPVAGGTVPGHLLNQFSMDAYEGALRVATTVGGRGSSAFFSGSGSQSMNDIYVLGKDLKERGRLIDLGAGERIYAARFMGDTGYLVTFRETDPFYVLDLSDPDNPKKVGELKIPGYSSYLHPLEDDLVFGIGKEDQNVKLSLFDVSSPESPKEISKYTLDEYWSEAIGNHRAFLADPKHKVFFLPGGQGGYIFSYDGGELSLKKAAKDDRIKRAVFIGDTFYIVSENGIYAYDESSWEKIGEFRL